MFVDSLHNQLILNFRNDYQICNTEFKAILAYNGSTFRDLDFGLNIHLPNSITGGDITKDCIPFEGKSLYGGYFACIGSDTLQAEALALWNGANWNTFPKFAFPTNLNRTGYFPVVNGFLKDNGKLWIYGAFKDLGGVPGYNIYTFDGNHFSAVGIPISYFSNNDPVFKMIKYRGEIYALGSFSDPPSYSISRFAKYDGQSWSSVGNGIVGSIDNAAEMIIYKDTLYIAGTFSKASGNAGNYIMKWDGTQLHDAGFRGFDRWWAVWKLLVYRNRLYAFGNFPSVAGQKAFGVAYYEDGKWTAPQDSISGVIMDAVVYNDELYISGGFKIVGDQIIKNFAKLRCPDFDAAAGCISGIHESPAKLRVKVFPNPTKERFQIESDVYIESVILTDNLGQEIFKTLKPEPGQEFDVSDFPVGIYFLTVKGEHSQLVLKVVKE